MDGGEEVCCGLEVAGCDPPEVLQAVEEALDEVSVAIELAIDGADDADIALAWYVSGCAGGFDRFGHGTAEVAAVGDDIAAETERFNQFRCGSLVGRLAGSEHEANRQTAAVDDRVDLAGQSPTGATDGVIRAPFLPPAAC